MKLQLSKPNLDYEEPPEEKIWELYHENSKIREHELLFHARVAFVNSSLQVQDSLKDAGYAHYCAPKIELPDEFPPSRVAFDDALLQRKSVRSFTPASVSLADVAKLCFMSMGETRFVELREGEETAERHFRVAPSGGALYPIECYVVSLNVDGLSPGIYHYAPALHALERLADDPAYDAIEAAAFPGLVTNPAALFLFSAVFERSGGTGPIGGSGGCPRSGMVTLN